MYNHVCTIYIYVHVWGGDIISLDFSFNFEFNISEFFGAGKNVCVNAFSM